VVRQQALILLCKGSIPLLPAILSRQLAQSGSASGLGPEGQRFKSFIADQFLDAFVAQQVEQSLDKGWVTDSNSVKCTNRELAKWYGNRF
jgi:hypothetical protein